MSLTQRYRADARQHGWQTDPAQERAVALLEALSSQLSSVPAPSAVTPSLWRRALSWMRGPSERPMVRGLYLYGGVGRGKTYLLDLFYDCLPVQRKLRIHFHHFMRDVHARRRALGDIQDPLVHIAADYADNYRVICFDEFMVHDITDAMILSRLLGALFVQGVVLVATSNFAPGELYADGFQRDRFLPAIALLQQYCQVQSVDNGVDYRLARLQRSELYLDARLPNANQRLASLFAEMAPDAPITEVVLEVNGRPLEARAAGQSCLWCDFEALCERPLGAADYLELACEYTMLFLSGVPALTAENDDAARRFITLVDALYDHRTRLVLAAFTSLDTLYSGTRLAFEFQRTRSRLHDMQTADYLGLQHLG